MAKGQGKPKKTASAETSPKLLSGAYPLLWFTIAAFILFGQSIAFNYTYLDDHNLVLFNLENLKSPSYFSKAFTEDVFHLPSVSSYYYRPVMTLSFMADAMIGNGSFGMFHFSNILYHILATFLLFLFFIELGFERIRVFLFSMLFLVHPLATQAVAWVPGRNDTLLAIFVLASFVAWIRYLKSGRMYLVILHLLCYALALLTKESAVMLPFMVVIFSWFVYKTPAKKFLIPGIGWLVLTITWAFTRFHVLGSEHGVAFSVQLISVIFGSPALLAYIGKAFFPFDLSVLPVLADLKLSMIFGAVAIVLTAWLAWLTKPKKWFYFFFGLLWFFAFLLPALVAIGAQVPNFSEHRIYLAMAGLLLVVMNCHDLKKPVSPKALPVSILTGILLLFSVLSFLHSRNFRDQFAFWQNAVTTSPTNGFNYKNLGGMYVQEGNMAEAEKCLRKALQLNPREPLANSDLGYVCVMTKRFAEGEKYYLEEIRLNPSYAHVHYNLGLLYYNQSRTDEAIVEWEKTISLNPLHDGAYKVLLTTYQNLNRRYDYQRIATMANQYGITPELQ